MSFLKKKQNHLIIHIIEETYSIRKNRKQL
jgi:hypothetical protein